MARSVPYVDPMLPDEREAKLPAWASAALTRLRSRVTAENRRADEARIGNGPADTDTVLDPYEDVPIRLPKGQRVRFITGTGSEQWIDVFVVPGSEQWGRPAVVELMGGSTLDIRPQSSNVVNVRPARD